MAREHGRRLGAAGDDLSALLSSQGYEPEHEQSSVRLRNCPFHRLAGEFPPLTCGMNLALLEGVVETCAPGAKARMDARPGRCCVVIDF